jgi:hypothetical protein
MKAKIELKRINGYAVFSIPTREARIFAGMKPERVSDIYEKYDDELQAVLESFQMGGHYDEMISGYSVRAVND